ncbi:MAG: ribonuclease E inhibitor RraB [Chitinophagaceae bacterium]|nr:ribonuclease E inhibitor RraB [Chitinophagaceae bacterium]
MTQLLNLACNKPSERFISEEQLRNQLAQQVLSNESKVQQLSQFGVDERSGISIDFFFITNDSSKAKELSGELASMQYHLNKIHPSANNQELWVVSGSSSRMNMKLRELNDWTNSLSKIAFRYDCAFNGWNPVTE